MRARCPKCHKFMKADNPCTICGFVPNTYHKINFSEPQPKIIDLSKYRYVVIQTTRGEYMFDQNKLDLILYSLSKMEDKN